MEENNPEKLSSEKENEIKTTRRSFLKHTGVACILLMGLGGGGIIAQGKELVRPPGGQDEKSLISKCIRCDRCRSICPTSAITLAKVSDGLLESRTPTLNFHKGYCTFCNKCVEVCPTKALKSFDRDTVKLGKAVVQKDICIAWKTGACTVCKEKCPYDAIKLDSSNRPIVDAGKCNGCGVCEYECPALVLRSYIGGKVRGIVVTPPSSRKSLAAKLLYPSSERGGMFI